MYVNEGDEKPSSMGSEDRVAQGVENDAKIQVEKWEMTNLLLHITKHNLKFLWWM